MKDKVIKIFKSNVGFIIAIAFLVVITLNPQAKGFVLGNTKPERSLVPTVNSILFTSSDGKILDLAHLKGKVVFLNFWATWCPPCIAEMPSINSLYNKLKKNENVIFILADVDSNLKRSDSFMKKNKYNLPVYIPSGPMPHQLFQGNLPTTVIINKRGEIVFNHEGMADYSSPEIEKFIVDLSK
jgi:thiol-disulfide isomerase/thioredoxin